MYEALKGRWLIFSVVALLTSVGFYLRVAQRAALDLWADELYVISAMSGSFFELVVALPALETSSYLSGDYYLIFPFYKIFGANKWGLTIPHAISTIFCFYFLYKVCRIHIQTVIGFGIAFALVAFNATLIFHSLEIRYYAVLQTIGVASYYFTYRIVNDAQKIQKYELSALGIFFIFSILFHLYSVIIIGSIILFFALVYLDSESWKITIGRLGIFFGPIFILTTPILIYVLFFRNNVGTGIWGGDVFAFIPNPLVDPIGFLKGIVGNLVGYKPFYFLLLAPMLAFLLPQKERFQQIWFLISLVGLPIAFLLFLDIVSGYWFIQRQFIWTMPLFGVFLAWSAESTLRYFVTFDKQ